jgi:hypothetical protein
VGLESLGGMTDSLIADLLGGALDVALIGGPAVIKP